MTASGSDVLARDAEPRNVTTSSDSLCETNGPSPGEMLPLSTLRCCINISNHGQRNAWRPTRAVSRASPIPTLDTLQAAGSDCSISNDVDV